MEYYGVTLPESDKAKINPNAEVYEIDCEALFYFELERFSKAQAVYGSNVTKYFECIQQDGASFPREFYPDSKSIYHMDIIYNVYTEMQTVTELFVLLSTGIDLEIVNIYSLPPQFKHSKLGDELGKIKDFLYNYYKRVYPKERCFANVMRKLPQLPIVYEPIFELISDGGGGSTAAGGGGGGGGNDRGISKAAKRSSVVSRDYAEEEEEVGSGGEYSAPPSPPPVRGGSQSLGMAGGMELEVPSPVREIAYDIEIPEMTGFSEVPVPPEFYDAEVVGHPPSASDPWAKSAKPGYFQSKGKRITAQLSKRRMKIVSVYKTLAQRLRLRSQTAGEQAMEETTSYAEEMGIPAQGMASRAGSGAGPGLTAPRSGLRFQDAVRSAQNAARAEEQQSGTVMEGGESSVNQESSYIQSPQHMDSPKPTKGRSKREKEKEKKDRSRSKDRSTDRRTQSEQSSKRHPVISEKVRREQILDAMRRRYRAPTRAESNPRRRGRLARMLKLDHNAFTYMVTRVLAFLQERGRVSEDELHSERFRVVDRNFVI